MKSIQLVSAVVVAAALVCCAGSDQTGVTNAQAPGTPGVAPAGECLARGTMCLAANECCSAWCANGYCAQKQP